MNTAPPIPTDRPNTRAPLRVLVLTMVLSLACAAQAQPGQVYGPPLLDDDPFLPVRTSCPSEGNYDLYTCSVPGVGPICEVVDDQIECTGTDDGDEFYAVWSPTGPWIWGASIGGYKFCCTPDDLSTEPMALDIDTGDGDDVICLLTAGTSGAYASPWEWLGCKDFLDVSSYREPEAWTQEVVVHAGDGTDVVQAGYGPAATAWLYGEDGDDWLTVFYGLSIWPAEYIGAGPFEHLRTTYLNGGNGNDSLHGGAGSDYLWGGSGNDGLLGNGGDDRLYGGPGDDYLWGGSGTDGLWGQNGQDWLRGAEDFDCMCGGNGEDDVAADVPCPDYPDLDMAFDENLEDTVQCGTPVFAEPCACALWL